MKVVIFCGGMRVGLVRGDAADPGADDPGRSRGVHAGIGYRLLAARRYLDGDSHFLATHGDALTHASLGEMIATWPTAGKRTSCLFARA
jgi:hypothetical protein